MRLLNKIWPPIGAFCAVIIGLGVFLGMDNPWDLRGLLWLNCAALLLHQGEEFIYPGGFVEFYNLHVVGRIPFLNSKLGEGVIFAINVPMGWTLYIISAVFFSWMWLGVATALVSLVNAVAHILMALRLRRYNPGLATSVLCFLPIGLWIVCRSLNHIDVAQLLLAFVTCLICVLALVLAKKLSG